MAQKNNKKNSIHSRIENVFKDISNQELDNSFFSLDKNSYRGSHQIRNAKNTVELNINDIQNKVIDANGGLSKQDYTYLSKLKRCR